MELPTVHSCISVMDQNFKLKKKLRKIKTKNIEISAELQKKIELERIQNILNNSVPKRHVAVQADVADHKSENEVKREQLFYKLVNSQNEVRKLYEKECKKYKEVNQKLEELKVTNSKLEAEIVQFKDKKHHRLTKNQTEPDDLNKIKELKAENQKLRQELRGLDDSFFEEIEDLKYSLKQSVKLNEAYEKCLNTLCQKYNLPFPQL